MPPQEYATMMSSLEENGDPTPEPSEPFSSEAVPGYSDGDYPPWLQQEMFLVLPSEVIDAVASRTGTMLNGDYCHIQPERLQEALERLTALGFELSDGTHLGTWY
jgi:hypothetical protein